MILIWGFLLFCVFTVTGLHDHMQIKEKLLLGSLWEVLYGFLSSVNLKWSRKTIVSFCQKSSVVLSSIIVLSCNVFVSFTTTSLCDSAKQHYIYCYIGTGTLIV